MAIVKANGKASGTTYYPASVKGSWILAVADAKTQAASRTTPLASAWLAVGSNSSVIAIGDSTTRIGLYTVWSGAITSGAVVKVFAISAESTPPENGGTWAADTQVELIYDTAGMTFQLDSTNDPTTGDGTSRVSTALASASGVQYLDVAGASHVLVLVETAAVGGTQAIYAKLMN